MSAKLKRRKSPASKPTMKPARRGTAKPLAAAAAAPHRITMELRTVGRQPIKDPRAIFTVRRVKDLRQLTDQVVTPLTGDPVTLEVPLVGDIVMVEMDLDRFRFARTGGFFPGYGDVKPFKGILPREPDAWNARFTAWDNLSGDFASLQQVLKDSTAIALLKTQRTVDAFSGHDYDRQWDEPVRLAKTALLNVFYRLRTAGPALNGDPWFSYVTSIIGFDRERFLAYVDAKMWEVVKEIHDHISSHPGFETSNAEIHRHNVLPALRPLIDRMQSIKSSHDKGNYQLTLSQLSNGAVVLDADIDESGTFWGHTADLVLHLFTRGTHPHDIHEILEYQDYLEEGFDLGYRLE
jgi:hypothetical protein